MASQRRARDTPGAWRRGRAVPKPAGGPPADGERDFVVLMTCVLDRREHAVTDAQVALGVHGRYRAVCGHLVAPGSLTAPPGHPCRSCQARLAPEPVARRATARWVRLLGRAAGRRAHRRTAAAGRR